MLVNKIYLLFLTKRDFMTVFFEWKNPNIPCVNAVQGRRNWDNRGGICYPSQYLADMLSNHIPIRQTDSALVCTPNFEGLPPALLSCMVFRHGTHMNKEGNVMIRDWHSRTNSRHYTETPCTEAKPSPPPTKSQKRRNRENPKICNKSLLVSRALK